MCIRDSCRRSECVFISSSRCDAVAVPCVRQCTRTDGSIGSACHDWVDGKYQGSYRVTTCCTYQSILVCTCSSNVDTVPCVRQCTRTDGSVGNACYYWVDSKYQGSYRVTTRCTYQCILVGSSSSNINTVPCVCLLYTSDAADERS